MNSMFPLEEGMEDMCFHREEVRKKHSKNLLQIDRINKKREKTFEMNTFLY